MNAISTQEHAVFQQYTRTQKYEQIENRYDPKCRALWSIMHPQDRACFNTTLLQNISAFGESMRDLKGKYDVDGTLVPVDYVVFASAIPGIFNLGGDLQAFRSKILAEDQESMRWYAKLCIDNIWNRLNHYGANITTLALVQGHALGGGFECALTSDVIIAERGSTMGLPEILFNLFPGMGALSLLARKIGLREAEEIVLSGKMYAAEDLYRMGVVDVLAEKGCGVAVLDDWIEKNQRRKNGYLAVQRSKQRIMPISYSELMDIAEIWVDSAMQLEERDLKMMGRLVHAQNRIGQVPA